MYLAAASNCLLLGRIERQMASAATSLPSEKNMSSALQEGLLTSKKSTFGSISLATSYLIDNALSGVSLG